MPRQIFAKNNLKITADANKKVVNFLDVTLDLNTGKFKPYSKPPTTPLYVHSQSNHPPNILTNIPEAINWRLFSTERRLYSMDVHTHTSYTQREISNHVLEGKKVIKRFKLKQKVKKNLKRYSS